MWVGRDGRSLGSVVESDRYVDFELDPQGKRLALVIENEDSGNRDLWIRDLDRGVATRIISNGGWISAPRWSPDGTKLAFLAAWKGPPNVYLVDASGGEPIEIVPYDGTPHLIGCWTPDGKSVIYSQSSSGPHDLWIVDTDSLQLRSLLETSVHESGASISPDGHWLAYLSSETGGGEIYVTTYPHLESRMRISTNGGNDPRWSGAGTELFYSTEEGVFVASFDKSGPTGKSPELVISNSADDLINYDVAPDGTRLIVLRADRDTREPADRLVTDWERLLE
jgi:Tol biopolymer transport system component